METLTQLYQWYGSQPVFVQIFAPVVVFVLLMWAAALGMKLLDILGDILPSEPIIKTDQRSGKKAD